MTFFFNVSSSLLFLELLSECSDMSERTQRHIATLRKELTQTWPPTTSCISCHCLSNPPTSHSQYNSPIHFWSLILFKLTLLRVAWSKTAAKTTSSFFITHSQANNLVLSCQLICVSLLISQVLCTANSKYFTPSFLLQHFKLDVMIVFCEYLWTETIG